MALALVGTARNDAASDNAAAQYSAAQHAKHDAHHLGRAGDTSVAVNVVAAEGGVYRLAAATTNTRAALCASNKLYCRLCAGVVILLAEREAALSEVTQHGLF